MSPSIGAPGEARRSIATLRGVVEGRALDDLALLISELVTNSVRHAGVARNEPISVRVEVGEEHIRAEVWDSGRGFDPARLEPPSDKAGWGLFLVDRLADRWGVRPNGRGTQVWFELARARRSRSGTGGAGGLARAV